MSVIVQMVMTNFLFKQTDKKLNERTISFVLWNVIKFEEEDGNDHSKSSSLKLVS